MLNLKLADPATAPAFAAKRTPSHAAAGHERVHSPTPVPAALAGHPRVERQPGQEPAASPDHGLLAAGAARRGQPRGPRRRPDGRPDAPRRTAQGRRRHARPGRRRAARPVRRRGAPRGGGRAHARIADRSLVHRGERRPPRQCGRADGRAVDDRDRDGRRARGRGRGDAGPRHPRRPDQRGPRTRRRGPPAAPQRPADRRLGAAARPAAARSARGRAAPAANHPRDRQHRDHGQRDRRRAVRPRRPRRRRLQPRSHRAAEPGAAHADASR